MQHQKLLQGYARPTTEVKSVFLEDTTPSDRIATTIEDIEEFRDVVIPIVREEEMEDYEDEEDDTSDEMEFEDYL